MERGDDIYAAALNVHIRRTDETLQRHPVLAGPIAGAKLRMVGASYDLATTKVTVY